MSLTPKQRRFVEAYLLDPNGKQAAIAAGYSEKNAAVEASRLLTHAKVVAELERRRKIVSTRSGVTPEMVIAELAKLGFSDIRQVVQWRANVRQVAEDPDTGEPVLEIGNEVVITDSAKLSDTAAAAILEISQTKDGTLKVRMHDKLGALVKIGQHFGMFRPVAAPEEKGKKEKAAEDARAATSSDAWGDDLAFNGARPN
ncbi:terminase small subunit [Azospirillum sp. B2RO_4]|uniref:terminase small subunit n=1 Tax=Azospirillum sp. B2RO_4 TaxID=3027796 RepID=UPI003DA7FE32